jgi:glycosyltransferase involved in cell wall biosynthesis
MRVLITVPSLDLAQGGPAENVPMLAHSLTRFGVEVGVASAKGGRLHSVLDEGGLSLFIHDYRSSLSALAVRSFLRETIERFDPEVVHDNGIWLPANHLAVRAARRSRRSLVISSLGMLQPWAVRYHGWRKRVAWWTYQRQDLLIARALVTASEGERGNILALLPHANVALVPNGWDPAEAFAARERSPRKVLFLSRVHPTKGIEILLRAWARVRPVGWKLDIVGPGRPAYVSSLESLAVRLKIVESVRFHPPQFGKREKNDLIGSAEIVVLPSFTEGFGSIVVEALGLGVPVITTTRAPWESLRTTRSGWWVEPTVDGLTAALQESMSLTDAGRAAMGQRGRDLVLSEFSWDSVARRMLDVYKRVI